MELLGSPSVNVNRKVILPPFLRNSTQLYEDGRIITGTRQPRRSSRRSGMPNGKCSGTGRNADTQTKVVNGSRSATSEMMATGHSRKRRQNWSSPTKPRSRASPRSQEEIRPMTQPCENIGRNEPSDRWEGKPMRNKG